MLKEKYSKIKNQAMARLKNAANELFGEIKSWELRKMTTRKAINLIIFLIAFTMGIYFQWKIIEIVIFLIFIGTILRPVASRLMAAPALFFLILTPIMLILKQDLLAEQMAIYAYYFLVITVILGVREVRGEK